MVLHELMSRWLVFIAHTSPAVFIGMFAWDALLCT